MKIIKLVALLVFVLLVGTNAIAQDVIVMKNGSNIRAIVEEIGINDVKYRKFESPLGPYYILRQSDIRMIRFEDGSREVFSTDNKPEQPAYTNRQNFQNRSRNQSIAAVDYNTFSRLRRNDVAMEDFLWQNDIELYEQFHKGVRLRRAGKGLFSSGLGLSIGGLCFIIVGSAIYENAETYDEEDTGLAMTGFGVIGLSVGQALIITSIPLSAVGGGLKKRAANNYEYRYFGDNPSLKPSLDFTFTGNGVGFALRF